MSPSPVVAELAPVCLAGPSPSVTVSMPTGWAERLDDQGKSETWTFDDPEPRSAAAVVVARYLDVRWGFSVSGQPQPQNFVPSFGVLSRRVIDPYRLRYVQTAPSPGYRTFGLIVDVVAGAVPEATVTVSVTVPSSQAALATRLIDSLTVA